MPLMVCPNEGQEKLKHSSHKQDSSSLPVYVKENALQGGLGDLSKEELENVAQNLSSAQSSGTKD